MRSTMYLYGVSPSEFMSLPYASALSFKAQAAKKLLYELMEPDYIGRDDERINAVFDAIKWNQRLLDEIQESL